MREYIEITSKIMDFLIKILTLVSLIGSLSNITNINIPLLSYIPPFFYYFLLFSLIMYLIINKVIKNKMEDGINDYYPVTNPIYGFKDFDIMEENKLLWIIRRPIDFSILNNPKKFDIDPEPKCPYCKMKLNYKQYNWWYQWYCINDNCKFIERTWNHKDKIMNNVRKKEEFRLENHNI